MVDRVFIFCGCLFVLSGCMYNDEPIPEIVHTLTPEVIISPSVINKVSIPSGIEDGIPKDWLPPSHLENKKRWHGIVIHHSASSYGCAAHEHEYHRSIGWNGLGYHFVINNGIFKNGYGKADGLVEVGYRWRGQKTGSHCRPDSDRDNYWNKHTVGICLIGNFNKTRSTEQQWRSLVKLVRFLQRRYDIPASQIRGHRDIKPTDCPGRYFSFGEFRRRLGRYK